MKDIFQKHQKSLIYAAVALVCIVVAFVLGGSLASGLREQITKSSVKQYSDISGLVNGSYQIPKVGVTMDRESLGVFPSPQVQEWGKKLSDKFVLDAETVFAILRDMNDPTAPHVTPEKRAELKSKYNIDWKRRDWGLLVPASAEDNRNPGGLFSAIAAETYRIKAFANAYDAWVRNFPSQNPNQSVGEWGQPATVVKADPGKLLVMLKATTPPTLDEIDALANKKAGATPRRILRGGPEDDVGPAGPTVTEEHKFAARKELVEARAAASPMYAMPTAIFYSAPIYHYQNPAAGASWPSPTAEQIFWAQFGLFIQQDVVDAIMNANAGSKKVADSTVKNLVQIHIEEKFVGANATPGATPSMDGMSPEEGMNYGSSGAAAVTDAFALTPTGHISNQYYDVVHFWIRAHVDATRLPAFLQNLSKDRLITVLETRIHGLDKHPWAQAGYLYGDSPVVDVELKCEAVFLRDWTKKYMTRNIKAQLGVGTDMSSEFPQ